MSRRKTGAGLPVNLDMSLGTCSATAGVLLLSRAPPTQWLEEAMVEAFTVRGLGLLASSWEENPPFAGDQAFAAKIREHRAYRLQMYNKEGEQDIAPWFRAHRSELESGRPADKDLAVLKILPILENDRACVEDLGAINRWPARTRVPIEEYLNEWERSCTEIGAPRVLPGRLRQLFEVR